MGLPMDDNIHAPTVPSGPTTANTGFGDLSKLSLMELMDQKERIESELSALSSVLTSVRPRPMFLQSCDRCLACTNIVLTSRWKAWSRYEHQPDNSRRISTE